MMKLFGLGYQKIDMCLIFYMLYYDEDVNFVLWLSKYVVT